MGSTSARLRTSFREGSLLGLGNTVSQALLQLKRVLSHLCVGQSQSCRQVRTRLLAAIKLKKQRAVLRCYVLQTLFQTLSLGRFRRLVQDHFRGSVITMIEHSGLELSLLPDASCLALTAYCCLLLAAYCFGAPAGIRTPNQQIMSLLL